AGREFRGRVRCNAGVHDEAREVALLGHERGADAELQGDVIVVLEAEVVAEFVGNQRGVATAGESRLVDAVAESRLAEDVQPGVTDDAGVELLAAEQVCDPMEWNAGLLDKLAER